MRVLSVRSTVLLLLATLVGPARAAVIDARDAAAHVGSTVTVEGDVVAARIEPIGMVLELAPVGPKSFRAVLVEALLSGLPRSPERIYQGKRVRITGLLQRFQGRPEMVLESRSQIEVVDVAGAPVSTTTTTVAPSRATTTTRVEAAPAMPPPAATAPAAPPRDTAPATPPPTTAPMVPAPPREPAPSAAVEAPVAPPAESEPAPRPLLSERLAADACERARTRWRDAAERARAAATELTRCLDAETFACHDAAAQMAPAIADLEWAEQQVAERCE